MKKILEKLMILSLTLLLPACGKGVLAPTPTVVPYTPEPEFERDAAVFGGDVEMMDLSEYAEEFRIAGVRYSDNSFIMPDINELRDVLQGKNVRQIRLDDTLLVSNIGKIELGRFGLLTWNLTEKNAGELAEMENCRALVYYDSGNWPLPENIVWPYLRSLSITSSQLNKWEIPISKIFPALRELILRYDMIQTLDLAAIGLPETLESIEIKIEEGDMKEVPAFYTVMTAKNIHTIQFINGKPADHFNPIISDQKKAEYERNLYLSDIICKVDEAFMENRGSIVKQEKPRISELQLLEGEKIMCIHEKDLSSCSYNGDNEKILAALTDDPKECDVLFIESFASFTDPNVRVVGATGSSSGVRSARSLVAVDMASGEIYYDTMSSHGFYGTVSDQQKKNNELYQEKGLWGFIEQLF
jgi:hypothetical protein